MVKGDLISYSYEGHSGLRVFMLIVWFGRNGYDDDRYDVMVETNIGKSFERS